MQEKDIILFYSEKGITYQGSINRAVFLDKMNKLISWYPTCNENAKALVNIIPKAEYFKINSDFNETQDIPIIEYKLSGATPSDRRIIKLMRPYTIIWSMIDQYCSDTMEHGMVCHNS